VSHLFRNVELLQTQAGEHIGVFSSNSRKVLIDGIGANMECWS
jgi:hypothetical protein